MDTIRRRRLRAVLDERGAYLFRYAVIIALFAAACVLVFTTVGQETIERIRALGERIVQA
jgi:Flp pilus assembly pilin Flp